MVQTMRKWINSAAEYISWDFHTPAAAPQPPELHKLGDYYADYSEVTPDQIKAAKAECAEHIARSKVFSVTPSVRCS